MYGNMRDPLGLSPWSFNNMNSYNSTKNSLLNTQTCPSNRTLEHLKIGKWEQTWDMRRENSSKEPWMQPCKQKFMVGVSPKRGRIRLWLAFPSMGGGKRFSGHSCRSRQYELQLSPETFTRSNTEAQLCLSGSWHSSQRSKAIESVCPVTSQSWPPFILSVSVQSTLSQTRELVLQNHFFPWEKGAQNPRRSEATITRRAKQHTRLTNSPSLPHPHTLQLHWPQHLASGDSIGISCIWNPTAHHIPMQGWSPGTGQADGKGGIHLPFFTTLWRSVKPGRPNKLKTKQNKQINKKTLWICTTYWKKASLY